MAPLDPWHDDVAQVTDLVAAGLSYRTVRRRITRGAWLEPAPGVVCRTTGHLTDAQREVVALLYAGPGSMLSHRSAGAYWSLGTPPTRVSVTVPHGRHPRSTPLVAVHQSRRPCHPRLIGTLLLTPPARTAIDICLVLPTLDRVRDVLGRLLQGDRATVAEVQQELECAPQRGSLHLRRAVAELDPDVHAASEARFARLIRTARLPAPAMNATVATARGVRRVDALWRRLQKGVEIDGRAYHLSPAAWAADLRRQNDIQSTGITLLRIEASRLWHEPEQVIAEVAAFLGIAPLGTDRPGRAAP